MADMVTQRNIAAFAVAVTPILPESTTGGTIYGATVDRVQHGLSNSAVLHQVVGAETGAPTTTSVQTILQHSPDGVNWTNFLYDGINVAQTAALTAANSENSQAIDLTLANRFIRPEMVVAFTGGATPSAIVMADLVLGGQRSLPAV